MLNDFTTEYSERSDDELLHLASARHSLTTEAATALDAELRRRNLTESEQSEYHKFVKQNEQREARKRRSIFGPMIRPLGFLGLLIVNTIVAMIGTAIVEHAIWRTIPAHSVIGVLLKEWIFSIVFATLIGFGMWRTWRSSAAMWTWLIPALWFTVGVLPLAGSKDVIGRIFGLHSESVLRAPDTRAFFTFTVPMIRAIFYSIGAYISSLLYSTLITAKSDS